MLCVATCIMPSRFALLTLFHWKMCDLQFRNSRHGTTHWWNVVAGTFVLAISGWPPDCVKNNSERWSTQHINAKRTTWWFFRISFKTVEWLPLLINGWVSWQLWMICWCDLMRGPAMTEKWLSSISTVVTSKQFCRERVHTHRNSPLISNIVLRVLF